MLKVAETIDLVAAFHASPNPYMVLDSRFRFAGMNPAYLQITHKGRDELIGQNIFEIFDGAGYAETELLRQSLKAVLETGQPHHLPILFFPIETPGLDGSPRLRERYWSATHTPIKDAFDRVTHILQHAEDVTDTVRLRRVVAQLHPEDAAEALSDIVGDGAYTRALTIQADNLRLTNERAQLLSMFMQAPGFVAILSGPRYRFQMVNAACSELLGHRELVGRTYAEAVPELVSQGYGEILDQVFRTGVPFQARQTAIFFHDPQKDRLEEKYLDFMIQPLREADGQISGTFIQGHDVTDSVLADQRQKLMIDELNHRVKNTLATVQSIAMQTARSHQEPTSFAETFQSRILALSHTHDLLTKSHWEGADLHEIIRHEIAAYGGNRLIMRGPHLALEPAMAVSLGMIFHELATNAAKYGALTPGSGQIVVEWILDKNGTQLELTWQEINGPAPATPHRRGFGSRLIERNVRHDLAGRVETSFPPGGFKAQFSIPLSKEEQ